MSLRGWLRTAPARFALALPMLLLLPSCGSTQSGEDRLRQEVEALTPRLEELSGLTRVRPFTFARRDRAELRAYVADRLAEELSPEELEGLEGAYRAFGLLPDTLDLRALLLELYTEQVVGYYDPETTTLFLVEDVPPDELRAVLAHELVHALQDQHADLRSLVERERGNDRQSAAMAAIEGHATLVMFALTAAELTGVEVDPADLPDLGPQLRPALEAQNQRFPVFRAAPRIIRETLLFPYLAGAGFVQALWRDARGGGVRRAPLGELLPASTEQVLHPGARFLRERDHPTRLVLADAARSDGWRTVYENTLGELEVGILLSEHLGDGSERLAVGWDGDCFRLLQGPAGRVLVWYSVWDDGSAADAFADAYRAVLEARPARTGSVERMERDGRPLVRVVEADAADALEGLPVPELVEMREDGG